MGLGVPVLVLASLALMIYALVGYIKQLLFIRRFPNAGLIYPLIGNANKLYNVSPDQILTVIVDLAMKTDLRKMAAVLGPRPVMMVFHPETTEAILNSNVHIEKSAEYYPLEAWLGTGLLLATGPKWRGRRKLLTPAFHFRILEDAVETFNRYSQQLVHCLLEDGQNGIHALDIFPYTTRCTLDIILESAMGKSLGVQSHKGLEYPQVVNAMLRLVQHRQRSPWLMPDVLFNLSSWKGQSDQYLRVLHGFTRSVIEQRREDMSAQSQNCSQIQKSKATKKATAFLDLLLQAKTLDGQELSLQDIQEEVDTFMFEGHDTTACALSWTILLLANHPHEQEQIFREQCEIFGDQENSSTGPVENRHLHQMRYLECCIKEALRLYPSVPVYGRTLASDMLLDGGMVPKGATFLVISYLLHRNPKIWDRPNDFVPDRFRNASADKIINRNPYSYVPFSAGPRNCIGQRFAMMEEKAILSALVRKIKFIAVDKVEDVKPAIEIVTRPYNGIRVKCVPR
uniref:Cytochrome P450 CYP4EB1 n=1 Tax=Tigriopus kingsejongensis TaxID=1133412 RepID=A0A2H4FY82_9MAXI|nr:cytochrome P450 CYP4EB1 [Tigriopus kingsejongensis]|eukprot:maker-scaffold146_size311726-snap-gene-1.17 protein:Tk07048 transcript:maker-scaffold146_size311726-snap-gene-1.17-mRNA-1 annotation:"cytochrome p450 4v2-like"